MGAATSSISRRKTAAVTVSHTTESLKPAVSLNQQCARLFASRRHRLEEFGVSAHEVGGAEVFDFGVGSPGSIAGGLLLAELCLADLASVTLRAGKGTEEPWPGVEVHTSHPLQACMASQYAGWPVSANSYFAMGSGPARIARQREPFFGQYPFAEQVDEAWLVLEAGQLPDAAAVRLIADESRLPPAALKIAVARTASLPGTLQVVARSIETTMHKLFELGFDLRVVRAALGSCPFPPIGRDDLQSIGWTNDAILYGSQVWLWVDCGQEAMEAVAGQLPSCASSDYGRPFAEIFERYGRDFYAIDRLLFSPAHVTMHNLRTGRSVVTGSLRPDLLRESFGLSTGA